ncbi:MAG: hypothetical protein RLZZ450_35 [Pseudomonadota bacterium]
MRHLIRIISLRHMTASPGRSLLTLLGVALGVALVFAIEVVNGSVMASFRSSIDQMAGKTALVVGESTGVDEELLDVVRGVPGVAVAAPVIQEIVRDVAHDTQLVVLAVDTLADDGVREYHVGEGDGEEVKVKDDLAFLNDPRGILLAASYAKKNGVAEGTALSLETTQGRSDFNVRGLLAPSGPAKVFGGDLLLMDVYAAQIAFERGKRFDRIDIVPAENEDTNELALRISRAIGQKASVTRPEQRSKDADQLLASFKLGLSIASLVALLVGGFIVYNALAIAVAQRRREIGILRALGATRGQVVALFVGEGVLVGAVGSCFGVLLGLFLGKSALATATASVSEMFATVKPESLTVEPSQLIAAISVGVGASFIAALFPARAASYIEPTVAMKKREQASTGALGGTARPLTISAAMLGVGVIVALVAHAREDLFLGVSVSVFFALATVFLAPPLALLLVRIARRFTKRRSATLRLGLLGFERNTGRNAIAIAALGMALANVVNIACFLESMKQNTISWFERSLKADILVFAGTKVQGRFERSLPESMLAELSAMPNVTFVNPLRMVRQQYRDKPFIVDAFDFVHYTQHEDLPVVSGDLDQAVEEIREGTGVAASESFARDFHVEVGDSVTLQTPSGPRPFRISVIYVDYSSELGILSMSRDVFIKLWKDRKVDSFGLYITDPRAAGPLRERIVRELGSKHQLVVLGNAEYKSEVLAMFDRSFSLMRSMEVIAIIVALLGIVNTLFVSVIDRTTELGTLKAIGAVSQQVRRMFVTEALMIGLAAAVLGVGGGLIISVYTVKELLRFQMGWSIAWQASPVAVVETVCVALLVALVGAWLPMRSAARLSVVEALQYE